MSQSQGQPNRLVHESSPYLRQHAYNPVDWYSWGPEALERARQFDRPIFLSIGYSACHWCHVMEHESFENDVIAEILNDHFVSIKVDREERPDLDAIYMTSVQLLSGQGGWPMTVFLTPELKPFFGGTYFPPDDRYGRPGFKRLLEWLVDIWQTRRADIEQQGTQVTEHIQHAVPLHPLDSLNAELLRRSVSELGRRFDPLWGGFGAAPKFLHTMDMRLLLRGWQRFDLPDALNMVRHSLEKMAFGGIYDHLGGGFARYSTDVRWLVPHFEKMLYDNALMVSTYLEAYQATQDSFFRTVVEETLAWVAREMTSPEGPFYSTLDADSEGEEGKFYVWQSQEIEQILGSDATLFNAVYGVEPEGNWEDPHHPRTGPKNILHRSKSWEQLGTLYKVQPDALQQQMQVCRERLRAVRDQRIWPGRDEKILTAWNGLMIGALAEAAQVLDQPKYAEQAARAADYLLTHMRSADGRLLRTCTVGSPAKLNAYLEDYAYLIDGLISLYEATFQPVWIEKALNLTDLMLDQFWDEAEGGFFFTGRDHEPLIARLKDALDNATPAGNGVAVTALLRLVKLTGRADLEEKAVRTLQLFSGLMQSSPGAAAQMLIAYHFYLGPVQEFAIIGDPAHEETQRVLRAIRTGYRPNRVVALRSTSTNDSPIPLLSSRPSLGKVTTYLCQNFTCAAPMIGAEAVEQALTIEATEA